MKAYTLRLDEKTLDSLKYIGLKEHKTTRQVMLELIHNRVREGVSSRNDAKAENQRRRFIRLLNRIPLAKALSSIREDRDSR